MRMLPTHSATEAEQGENCSFFFATCHALTCFDELSRKKKLPRFARVENMLYVLRSIFSFQKKTTQTKILNLDSIFIFNVLVFKTLLLIPDADWLLVLHAELLKPALFVKCRLCHFFPRSRPTMKS